MRLLLVLLLLALPCRPQAEPVIAIIDATVVDGTGAAPRQAIVLIRGDRIAAVGPDVAVPPDAKRIQASGHTLLPGLFDLHTHAPYSAVSDLSGDWPKNLKAYLYCGVTTVADFGTYAETFEPMRRLLRDGVLEGPRLHLAARVTTPGGHGAEGGRGDFFSLEVITPREARAAMRRLLPYRPDAIKVFTDGWRYDLSPDMTSMELETLAALVEEAHKEGVEVLTHTVTLARAKIAARAGVDAIAHGVGDSDVDQELIALMREKGVAYVPTMAVYESRRLSPLPPLLGEVLEPAAEDRVPHWSSAHSPQSLEARKRRWQHLVHNTAALHRAGVPVGLGTDAGVTGTYHGWSTLRELQLLVSSGLSPLEALTAATGNSARAIHVDHERGTIQEGKLADLVLIQGAPHSNIADIERIQRVFLGGREIDRPALAKAISSGNPTPLPPRTAAELIDDFESPDGRTRLGTLRVNSTDSGHDNSRMLYGTVLRSDHGHALALQARMSHKDRPFARIHFPLTPGAVEPADLRAFTGVEFEARGEGTYTLRITTAHVRDFAEFSAPFEASGSWKTIRIPFAVLARRDSSGRIRWRGDDVTALQFEVARPAGEFAWLELDNLRFYR